MQSFYDTLQSAGVTVVQLSAAEDALEERWRASTEAGNRAFECHDEVEAARLYAAALTDAEALFDMALDGGSPILAPMVLNVASAKWAVARMRSGDRTDAFDLLLRAFEKLVSTAEASATPFALRVNCVRHMVYPFNILARDFQDEMQRPEVKALFRRAGEVAVAVGRVAGWAISRRERLSPDQSPDLSARLN